MKLPIKKIQNIIRQLALGMSNRAIGRQLMISANTARKVRRLCEQSCDDGQVDYEHLLSLDELKLREKLGLAVSNNTRTLHQIKPHPDWQYIHEQMHRPNVTLERLWQEFRRAHPDGISYSQFCKAYAKHKKSLKLSQRQHYTAGDMAQVDFCGSVISIYDAKTGGVTISAQIFVGVLPASGLIFCTAVASQGVEDWQLCHIRMFEYFGGVPLKLVTDNLKSAVIKNNRETTIINASFAELANHYQFIVLPTRVRKPQDKSMVELAVKAVQQNILAMMRDRRFFSLDELNRAIEAPLEQLNNKITKTYPKGRRHNFDVFEKMHLNPLPAQAYEVCHWQYDLRVSEFYTVTINQAEYSVPHSLIGSRVDAKITYSTVYLYHYGICVATHRKLASGSSILFEHMPKNHQLSQQMQPEALLHWAAQVGHYTHLSIDNYLHNHRNYASNLKKLNQLKRYLIDNNLPYNLIEQGFVYAHECRITQIDRVINLFKQRAYLKSTLSGTSHSTAMNAMDDTSKLGVDHKAQTHDNLRGAGYYADIMPYNHEFKLD